MKVDKLNKISTECSEIYNIIKPLISIVLNVRLPNLLKLRKTRREAATATVHQSRRGSEEVEMQMKMQRASRRLISLKLFIVSLG